MNWTTVITSLLSAGALSAFASIYATHSNSKDSKHKSSNSLEETYADHMPEMWKQINSLTKDLEDTRKERDDLRVRVGMLQDEVRDLTSQVKKLTGEINYMRKNRGENND